MFLRDRRLAVLCLLVPIAALCATAGCSASDDFGAGQPLTTAFSETASNERSIAEPGACGTGAAIAPDRCIGKEDGVYCSVLQDYAGYECKGGQILKGLQCASGKGKCLGGDASGQLQCGDESEDASQGFMGAAGPGARDPLTTYAEECKADVGLMPAFDCMDFPELDTTQGGSKLSVTKGAKGLEVVRADGKALETMADGATPRCDEPSWASTPCWPGTRIGVVDGTNGSKWAVLCRRQSLKLSTDPLFTLVGVIAHNASTGGTCFFDKAGNKTFTKTKFPQPGSSVSAISKEAQLTWIAPMPPSPKNPGDPTFENCVACHAAGPFIRSSYIPAALRDKLTDAMDPTGDYKIVGTVFQKEWKATTPKELAPAGGSCSDGCHRISDLPQSRMFAHLTIGGPEVDGKASAARLARDKGGVITRWPLGYFMPPSGRRKASLADWMKSNGAEQADMLACLNDPKAKGCTQTAFITGL